MNSKIDKRMIPKSTSWQMFDEISPRYDFLNHLLSFGLDIHWRKQLVKFLKNKKEQKILDLATGTGDVLLSIVKNSSNIQTGCGIDLAEKMMAIGRRKVIQQGLASQITLQHGDAHQIPFPDNTFDAVSIAFGIRNMEKPNRVLNETHRVLRVGGRTLILEFSLPHDIVFQSIHLFYLRQIVPLMGGLLSGYTKAYRYLNQTIETFPYGEDFCALLTQARFQAVRSYPLLFGIATIYTGDK